MKPEKIYNFDPQTGEYLGESAPVYTSLEPDTPVLHIGQTLVPPVVTGQREVCVYELDGSSCSAQADWRDVPLWDCASGWELRISKIGQTPVAVGATDVPRPSDIYVWQNGTWVLAPAKQAQVLEATKAAALLKVRDTHAQAIRQLSGNYSNEERDTWPEKVFAALASVSAGQATADATRLLGKEAEVKGVTVLERCQRVLQLRQVNQTLVGIAGGIKTDMEDAIQAATTPEAVAAALVVGATKVENAKTQFAAYLVGLGG